jgi:hypothetical protein
MKYFILLAIIFFSFRVFSEDTYYYEGRYYKIDEYIRFLDDPNYREFMRMKKEEEKTQKSGLNSYFFEKEESEKAQENARRRYVNEELSIQQSDAQLLKADAEHEKEKLAEEKQFENLQKQYVAEQAFENEKLKPKRMIASIFETDEEKPLKRIPMNKRKYVLKGRIQKKK